MKKSILILTAIAGIVTASIAFVSCNSQANAGATGEVLISKDSLIKRGKYLVNAIGCDDCHSPKIFTDHGFEIDMEHRFGGHLLLSIHRLRLLALE
jgi:hypothetical protein